MQGPVPYKEPGLFCLIDIVLLLSQKLQYPRVKVPGFLVGGVAKALAEG